MSHKYLFQHVSVYVISPLCDSVLHYENTTFMLHADIHHEGKCVLLNK